MELAENVEKKRPVFIKSDTFDSGITIDSRVHLKGNIKAFAFAALLGLFLIAGGGLIFIYRNIVMPQQGELQSDQQNSDSQDTKIENHSQKDALRNREDMAIIALVFIGVGGFLFLVGFPVVILFFIRYYILKDAERSPILTEKMDETKPKTVLDPSSTRDYAKRRNAKTKKRTSASWMRKTTRTLSRDGFRFAAHRHPSLNHISIDGSQYFFRRFSDNSSSSSEHELPTIHGSPLSTAKTRWSLGSFVRGLFKQTQSPSTETGFDASGQNDHELVRGNISRDSSVLGDFKFFSSQNSEEHSDSNWTANADINSQYHQDGLYNLGSQ